MVRLIFYSLTFKCQGSTAVVLLLLKCHKIQYGMSETTRHLYKVSDILNLTNLQQTVANKKSKKVYKAKLNTRWKEQ